MICDPRAVQQVTENLRIIELLLQVARSYCEREGGWLKTQSGGWNHLISVTLYNFQKSVCVCVCVCVCGGGGGAEAPQPFPLRALSTMFSEEQSLSTNKQTKKGTRNGCLFKVLRCWSVDVTRVPSSSKCSFICCIFLYRFLAWNFTYKIRLTRLKHIICSSKAVFRKLQWTNRR